MSPLERHIELELRSLRDRLAREQGVEGYKIFHNETIDHLAREKPTTNLELLNIKGIGPSKAKYFGKQILKIILDAGQPGKQSNESEPNGDKEGKVYSVGEFLDQFNSSFARKPLAIKGEIFDTIDRRGTNVYFKIKDESEEAVLSCYMRSSVEERIGIELEEGSQIILSGYLGAYKPSGRFSLQVTEFILHGEGMLKIAYEQLMKRLEAEGLFKEERKRPLPPFIRNVGLITAKGSDAERDFITHVGNFGFNIERYDVRVEGLRSAEQICRAFEYFNSRGTDVDVIVLTRGGGSLESLQSFNSERVARAIFSSRIPVLCGVGHEKDISLADLVADMRASTPTHAGKILCEDWSSCEARLDAYSSSLTYSMREEMQRYISSCESLLSSWDRKIETLIMQKNALFFEKVSLLSQKATTVFESFTYLEKRFNDNIYKISALIQTLGKILQTSSRELVYKSDAFMTTLKTYLDSSEQRLILSSPQGRLKQGYSILIKDNAAITDVSDLKKGDEIKVKLYRGSIGARVENTLQEDELE